MRNTYIVGTLRVLAVLFAVSFFTPVTTFAHCDTLDGPVVKAAQQALQTGNVNLVLIWVQQKDEVEIKQAFRQTLAVRRLGREARQLAGKYFFETLVRIHRAGEGEPYTGLKPAGTDLGPVIPVADKALENGSVEPLLKLFPDSAGADIRDRFSNTVARMGFNKNDVEAGRTYVGAYVSFLQYLEHLYEQKSSKVGATDHV